MIQATILVNSLIMNLTNKHILLGVSGGIAAYKSAQLLRELQRLGAQVRVAMTESATDFVTPLTFQALSGHPVHSEDNGQFDTAGMDHIALSRWADFVLIAPATANFLAKIAQGLADDFLSSLCLAHNGKLALAPAMNQAMWGNPATQSNLTLIKERGIYVFGPDEGVQACGEHGEGRMLEPTAIALKCSSLFSTGYASGKKILITAGPTVEPIDPVRFISNRSSGKMGYALGDAFMEAGGQVTIVSGPTQLEKNDRIEYIDVETAEQMHTAVMANIDGHDIFIAAAAVADYRPSKYYGQKIKKEDDEFTISLSRTADILKDIKETKPELFSVGFAAETQNVASNARIKLENKSIDMVIANQVGLPDQGFDSDYNAVEVLWLEGNQIIERSRKNLLARTLVKLITTHYEKTNNKSNVSYLPAKQN